MRKIILLIGFCFSINTLLGQEAKLLMLPIGHTGPIGNMIVSPDHKFLATYSYEDNTTKIWEIESGKLLSDIKHCAYISPDWKIYTFIEGNEIKVCELKMSTLLYSLKGCLSEILWIKFFNNWKSVIAYDRADNFTVWDVSGKMLSTFKSNLGPRSLFSVNDKHFLLNDEKHLFVTFADSTVKVWDSQKWICIYNLEHKKYVDSVCFWQNSKLITYGGDAKIWDLNTGKSLPYVRGDKKFSNSKSLFTTFTNNNVEIYQTSNGKKISSFLYHSNPFSFFSYSPDEQYVLIASWKDSTLNMWNISTGKLFRSFPKTDVILNAKFSDDGTRLIAMTRYGLGTLWDVMASKKLYTHNWVFSDSYIKFVPDKNILIVLGTIINSATGTLFYEFKFPINISNTIRLNSNDMIVCFDENAAITDMQTWKLKTEFNGHTLGNMNATFSKDNKHFFTSISGRTFNIWDKKTNLMIANNIDMLSLAIKNNPIFNDTLLKEMTGFMKGINPFTYDFNAPSSDNDDLTKFTSSADGSCKRYDIKTAKLLYTFYTVDSADYLVTDPYGRYDGTEAARKLLYFTCGTEVIGLDQVKDQLWVPNLAERIMKGDSINAKKLSDLDICGLVPEVEKEEKNGYHFNITPRRGGLGETVLLVNDIEVKRYQPNQLVKTATGYELNVTEQELQSYFIAGKLNPVTVKAYTAKNDIASRGVQVIQDETKKQAAAPNLYAVMIGVSDYKGTELQLKYAAKDATDISAAVAASAGKLLGKEHVFTYNLTTAANHYQLPEKIAIKNVFGEIGKKATANDILLVFFAGHGVTSGEKKQFYFLTADASQSSATEAPDQVGISTKELSEWMQPTNIKAQKRILILDACNSGQAINEIVKIGNADQNYLAARNDDKAEQIKAIDKLNEKSGLFILAASASNQSAYEMGRYSQGLLTYSLLKAIKQQPDILEDGKYLNVSRWFNAAEKTVSDLVRETGNRQEPQIVSAGNFNIGLVDPELMAGIKLAEEKPLFTASNFQNNDADIGADDLGFNPVLDNLLIEISARGENNAISYIPGNTSPEAYSLSGRYELKAGTLTVKVNIRQNKETKYKFELSGKNNDLKGLAKQVINEAASWIFKKKIR